LMPMDLTNRSIIDINIEYTYYHKLRAALILMSAARFHL